MQLLVFLEQVRHGEVQLTQTLVLLMVVLGHMVRQLPLINQIYSEKLPVQAVQFYTTKEH